MGTDENKNFENKKSSNHHSLVKHSLASDTDYEALLKHNSNRISGGFKMGS